MKRKKAEPEEFLAVQVAAAKPFLAAAGEDAGRSVCAIKPALGIPPLDRAVGSDRSLVCHDRSLTRGDEIERGGRQRWSKLVLTPFLGLFAGVARDQQRSRERRWPI